MEIVLVKSIQAVLDSETGRIVGRLQKGDDLLDGIKDVCRKFDLEAGQFQCMGSLSYATYVQLDQSSSGQLYYSPKVKTATPIELLSGTGFIGIDEEGELDVHFHGVFVDCNHAISGGHFIRGENPVAITIEFILFPLRGVTMQRKNDEIHNVPIFQFSEKG